MDGTVSPERREAEPYDALIVLGGGLTQDGEGHYQPTTYEDGDDFGMLGAEMRVLAAVDLYEAGVATTVVFSTGVTEKNKAKFGDDVPTEASVYAAAFQRRLDEASVDSSAPDIILEDRSFSTLSNVEEVMGLVREHGWQRVAVVTSDYHVPRVRALYDEVLRLYPVGVVIDFISAEEVVTEAHPGEYDDVIAEAYATPEAVKRRESEQNGLLALWAGRYALNELQLVLPDAGE